MNGPARRNRNGRRETTPSCAHAAPERCEGVASAHRKSREWFGVVNALAWLWARAVVGATRLQTYRRTRQSVTSAPVKSAVVCGAAPASAVAHNVRAHRMSQDEGFVILSPPRPLVSDPILTLRATVLTGFNGSERSRALWTSTTRYLHADIFRLRPGIPYYKCFNRHSAALGVVEWYVRGGPWHPI